MIQIHVEYTEAKQICDTLSGECLIEECTENNVLLCYETMAEYKRKGVLINRLDTDYLVLITDDGEYQVMDFGENFSAEGFSEGDDVVITYTGTLENEEKPPVITAMEAAQ